MRYLLDTNVLSELRRGFPAPSDWIGATPSSQRFISVVSLGEIMKGIEQIRSREQDFTQLLSQWLAMLQSEYAERTMPIDTDVALEWGRIAAGRSRGAPDALIAATAIVHDLTLVTRNVKDFQDLPLKLFNPWSA